MKKMKWMILALALATPLSALAVEDNGSGYNGPDLSPGSIPVELERGISLQAIQDAITVCVAAGDKESGLKSLMEKFAEQIGAEYLVETWGRGFDFRRTGVISVGQLAGALRMPTKYQSSINYSHNVSERSGCEEADCYHSVMQMYFSVKQNTGYTLHTKLGTFPLVSYEKVLEDGAYDDFGEVILPTRIVSGLRIVYQAAEGESLSRIPLYNYTTGARTRFTINGEEYVQCLQSELQKRAE